MFEALSLEDAAHLIQTALTPVFLLSGVGALLNVFASRLARVADQADALTKTTSASDNTELVTPGPSGTSSSQKLLALRRRALILDFAVVLATAAAAATCLAILTLFLFALSKAEIAGILLTLFGVAILCTLGSVLCFGLEMVLSNHALRQRLTFHLPWHHP